MNVINCFCQKSSNNALLKWLFDSLDLSVARLSSPDVEISSDQKSITINFSHRLELKPEIKLEFLLYLFEKSPAGESKVIAYKVYLFQCTISEISECSQFRMHYLIEISPYFLIYLFIKGSSSDITLKISLHCP